MLFVLTPGLDWAYAIQAGIGKKSVVGVSGLLLGHTLMTMMVIAGLGLVIASQPVVMHLLMGVGCTYLAWVGIGMILHPSSTSTPDSKSSMTERHWLLKGMGVSGLNPKVLLLILALLPQFVDDASPVPAIVQLVVLGTIHLFNCAFVYMSVSFGAQKVLLMNPMVAKVFTRFSGFAMLLITAIMLVEQFG